MTHPLVNILRGAMSILVSTISHPQTASGKTGQSNAFGFRALKPAISIYPQFLEMLVSRLSSADHALCANALQLINSLIREAITHDAEAEWPKFIRRLQDLGVIKSVYTLMQSTALQDLAHPLVEFQALSKVLLRKWKEVTVDLGKSEHRRALKSLHLASNPEKVPDPPDAADDDPKRRHNPEKWRRLGFESETPAWEFQGVGYLGMMDLTDYVKKHEDGFQKLLLEQSSKPLEQRCPIARASLAVTEILYEHFEVDKSDLDDSKNYLALESRSGFEKIFKPLILQWSRLHVCGLHAFFRLWARTGAELDDFTKVVELVRILVEAVVGSATRTKDVNDVDKEIEEYEYQRLRQLQMELLELTYEDTWGHHLRQVRDELSHEALQFVKEQRIRCLLQGAWFPNGLGYKAEGGLVTKQDLKRSVPSSYRYVRLSHNRRYLHYANFDSQADYEPQLDALPEKSKFYISSTFVLGEKHIQHKRVELTDWKLIFPWYPRLPPTSPRPGLDPRRTPIGTRTRTRTRTPQPPPSKTSPTQNLRRRLPHSPKSPSTATPARHPPRPATPIPAINAREPTPPNPSEAATPKTAPPAAARPPPRTGTTTPPTPPIKKRSSWSSTRNPTAWRPNGSTGY